MNFDDNPQAKTLFTFAFAFAALFLLIMATQVQMPMRAILIALAFSDLIFLGIVLLGNKIPGGPK